MSKTQLAARSVARRVLPARLYNAARNGWNAVKELRRTDDRHLRVDPSASALSRYCRVVQQVIRPRRVLLSYPERLRLKSIAFKLASLLGYAITADPSRAHDVAFRCRDTTFAPESDFAGFVPDEKVVNRGVNDISKERVAEKLGYAVAVDPFTYDGRILAKSTLNGYKDGRILQGPLKELEQGMVYQKYIDSDDGNGYNVDLRTLVYHDRIPLVYKKQRRIGSEDELLEYESPSVHAVEEVFSHGEQKKLFRFTRLMGIDYGEFDVMRDNHDGRIYVVDANSTPYGPPKGLPEEEGRRALLMLAPHFEYSYDQFAAKKASA